MHFPSCPPQARFQTITSLCPTRATISLNRRLYICAQTMDAIARRAIPWSPFRVSQLVNLYLGFKKSRLSPVNQLP